MRSLLFTTHYSIRNQELLNNLSFFLKKFQQSYWFSWSVLALGLAAFLGLSTLTTHWISPTLLSSPTSLQTNNVSSLP